MHAVGCLGVGAVQGVGDEVQEGGVGGKGVGVALPHLKRVHADAQSPGCDATLQAYGTHRTLGGWLRRGVIRHSPNVHSRRRWVPMGPYDWTDP